MQAYRFPQIVKKIIRILLISAGLFSMSAVFSQEWIYTVRKGDTLWSISIDYLIDTTYAKRVQKLNKVSDPWHLLPGTELKIPEQWIRLFPALVRVHNLQGKASLLSAGSNQLENLENGSIVLPGDTVITQKNSSLVLAFLDGSEILLLENSRLKIEQLKLLEYTGASTSMLKLEKGHIETHVTPNESPVRKFQIYTPASVTSVRGTDYRINAQAKTSKTSMEVVEGKVDVKGKKKKRTIKTGFGTVTVKDQDPLPPIELLPAPNLTSVPSLFNQVPVKFNLPELDKEQTYRVQIAKKKAFKNILFNDVFDISTIRGPDLPDDDYFIRIRAIDEHQLEGLNNQKKITINARPESPFLIKPSEGIGFLLEETPEFSWSEGLDVDNYHFQIAKDPEFSQIILDESSLQDTSITVDNKMILGKYYWRVAAKDHQGDGPFSDPQMFRRIPPAPLMEAPEITEDSLTIRSRKGLPGQQYHFQMSESEDFSEILVDKQTNEPKLTIDKPDSGSYFVRVQTIDADGFIGPYASPQKISIPYNFKWMLSLLPLLVLIAL